MQVTKITLSDEEMQALSNARFFRIKQDVTVKIMELLAELEHGLKKEIGNYNLHLDNLEKKTGKIFKGESYKGLPYILLDFPKLFSADNVLAFRSMFWWGNEFSFTLHLQGRALEKFLPAISNNINRLSEKGFYFCVHHSPWEYTFTEDNYLLLDDIMHAKEFSSMLTSREFIKLSRRIPLSEYDKVKDYGTETFKLLMQALS